jgi:spermidine/putrescine transport system substrate-binding protein
MRGEGKLLRDLELLDRAMTRRNLLRGGLAVGAGALAAPLLAACGSSGSAASTGGASGGTAGTIEFISYVAYDLKFNLMNNWRAAHGINLKSTYISDQSDVTAKLTSPAGRGLYNLSSYSAQYGPFYKNLGILTPLDMTKVPNYADSMPFFKSGKIWSSYWHFDGQQWGIPFTWGYDSINYDSAKVKPITRTSDFIQPELKNKFAIADDMLGMILMSAQSLGIANPQGLFTKSELNQIVQFLTKMKNNARTIASGFGDIVNLYASGEIVANISGFPGMQVLVAQKGINSIRSALPEEGSLSYCDTYFIPAGGGDTDSVYAFINECLTPPMQAQEAGYLQAGVTTVHGAAAVTAPNRVYVPYNDVTSLFVKAPLFGLPFNPPSGYASFTDWNNAWESVKAS